MKNFLKRKGNSLLFSICFLLPILSFGQLSNFNLNVVPTNETCLGNGSLTFFVTNTTPNATFDYRVYLLPNTTTPLVSLTSNTVTGLNAGNYRVIATQSLGGASASKQQDVTITNLIVPLTYSLSGTNAICGSDGKITVNVNSGVAVSYQIIAGPVLIANQVSNVFNNIPAGQYQIRVINNCGEGVVQTFTLLGTPLGLTLSPTTFPSMQLPSCSTISISNILNIPAGNNLAQPLQLQYTVFPPGGGSPIIQNSMQNTTSSITQVIPFYNGQTYSFNLKITDGCGNIYNFNNNQINQIFGFTAVPVNYNCSIQGIQIIPNNFVAPYSVSFLSAPTGFNAISYNAQHPGPFSSNSVTYGSPTNGMPLGNYTIKVTDFCGRTFTSITNLVPPEPILLANNTGCSRSIKITSVGAQMTSIILQSAPTGYPFSIPQNLTSQITAQNELILNNLPQGTYTFQITTNCGFNDTRTVTIPPYTPGFSSITQAAGCATGFGSIRLNSSEVISDLVLSAAPASYMGTLPANLTSTVNGSLFFFGSVPAGNYTFKLKNQCAAERTEVVAIIGYQVTSNVFTVTENCGSFNLFMNHQSTGNFQEIICLQKLNITTNQWGHPLTGIAYANGTTPTTINSVFLNNNASNINLAYTGQFRVLKRFQTYNSLGDAIDCFDVLYTFTFTGVPRITNVFTVSCANGSKDVIVEAVGVAPLQYRITSRNGIAFVVNNGTSSTFSGLTPAVYNFQVQDVCGNLVNSVYDVTSLPAFIISASSFCNGQQGTLSVPNLSFLNYRWWKGTASTATLSTSNQLLFSPYNVANDVGIYYVQITNPSNITSCINTTLSFTISPATGTPNAGADNSVSFCGGQGQINLNTFLVAPFDANGIWTETTGSGTLSGNLWNATTVPFGQYQFNYKVNGLCATFDDAVITLILRPIPATPIASANALICENQTLNLLATTIPNATYLWTGPNGFTSSLQNPNVPNATLALSGIYSVKSTLNGCSSGTSSVTVTINAVPKFNLTAGCFNNKFSINSNPINNSYQPNAVSYLWNGPDNYTNTSANIDISGLPSGNYTLTITNSQGCSTSNSNVILGTACEVQQGLSPNGDNTNENFDLSGFNIDKLKIFNRYGMVVYEFENYTNQWYGQDYNDNLLPSATYFYLIKNKVGESRTGWVYLQR